jgi:hypothetical protein
MLAISQVWITHTQACRHSADMLICGKFPALDSVQRRWSQYGEQVRQVSDAESRDLPALAQIVDPYMHRILDGSDDSVEVVGELMYAFAEPSLIEICSPSAPCTSPSPSCPTSSTTSQWTKARTPR